MKRFPRGSEWRKWDLHIHPPGTKLNDGYELKDGQVDWDRFCKGIYESNVHAIGIADYFSLDGFFVFKENYDRVYPESNKVFFPNLELRLNETVNRAMELVDFHVVFPPNLTREQADEFLRNLKTQCTDSKGRKLSCAELQTCADYESVSISRDDLKTAIENTYGKGAEPTDHFLLIAAVNNNGLRPDTGNRRKMMLSDEVDKTAHGFFGNTTNTDYFLNPDRLEAADQKALPKPVFAGCDAHNYNDLKAWLGNELTGDNEKHPTWIKADLTFEGLQQTLIEPAERVKIQATPPDKKEPYKIISRILFKESEDFPAEVVFNPGLNAIIGSRSSGKSALLAYVAHAVDPAYTVQQQIAAGLDERDVGPGASITWEDVRGIEYSVEWASPTATTGQIIYIPQNSLYAISERPDDITDKIQPAVFRNDPDFEAKFRKTKTDVQKKNETIQDSITEWFEQEGNIRTLAEEIRGLGDRQAITDRQTELIEQIKILRESSALTEEEVELYQQIVCSIATNAARLKEIEQEQRDLGPYVKVSAGGYEATNQVAVSINATPSSADVPSNLRDTIETILDEIRLPLLDRVKSSIVNYRLVLDNEQCALIKANEKLHTDNKDLIEKNVANKQIAELVKDLEDQKETIAKIDKKGKSLKDKKIQQREMANLIAVDIKAREQHLETLASEFNATNHKLEEMVFTIEVDYDPEDINQISNCFNKQETSPYIITAQKRVDLSKVMNEPDAFVGYMGSGKQKLKLGHNVVALTKDVLTTTKNVRFVASLEGDRIGGFKKSSMTPGKQSLFALTLILAESDEPWPLLIDQPEDDLDSRSVCDVIIKDLMRRKRERQVIMVSHNANLVVGADSEEVIVANRHGDDRPNRDGKMFAYLTGSLEYSKPKEPKVKFVLEAAGIREHACEILDGGAEAFQKRRHKYRIS
jgi:hypothetical protein